MTAFSGKMMNALADLCDAGRILGPSDANLFFWNVPCPKQGIKWVSIPQVSPEEFWLCSDHAEKEHPG